MTFQFSDFDDDFSALLEPIHNRAVAVNLAELGIQSFPIVDWRDGDRPKPIRDFNNKATTDVPTIGGWFDRYPDAWLGIVAGERNGFMVLDIDTKNGKDGVASMAALGFPDLAALTPVRVRTPSGGWHLYFKHDPRLKNSASRIGVGIDVKTTGGFVIAPASRKGAGVYLVDGAELGTTPLPDFPEALIPPPEPEVEIPPVTGAATDEQREWAAAHLERLASDLGEMSEGGRNAALNDAAMWAGGAAARGFVSESDAETILWAAAEAAGLRRREFRGTFKSGWKAGLKKPIAGFPRAPDLDALEDLAPLDGDDFSALLKPAVVDDDFVNSVTKRLNRRHAIVVVRGKTLATTEGADGSVDFGRVQDLHQLYANDLVSAGKDARQKPKFEAASMRWMRDPDRRTYVGGVAFAPGGCPKNTLNLWRGWAVAPDAAASCELFLTHVRRVICRGNEEHAAYIFGWLAQMVQHPDQKPGVALVLRGPKGAGKDTIADYVARMIGRRHAPTVAQSDHVTGQFNARLENALLLHVQEGHWAGDRKAEGTLKFLVTSDFVEIEHKGIDSINMPSVLRLFISANADWVVPASPDERRWAVFEVSSEQKGDDQYFSALRREMNGDGPAALLHFLQTYDLSGFNVRQAPDTEGLVDQKLSSLKNINLWWFSQLSRGIMPGDFDTSDDWSTSPRTIGRDALRSQYSEWMKGRRYDGEIADDRLFGKRLREMLPSVEDRRLGGQYDRTWRYVLPPLPDCRAEFERWVCGSVDWE